MPTDILDRVAFALFATAMPLADLGRCLGIASSEIASAARTLSSRGIVFHAHYLPHQPLALTAYGRRYVEIALS